MNVKCFGFVDDGSGKNLGSRVDLAFEATYYAKVVLLST